MMFDPKPRTVFDWIPAAERLPDAFVPCLTMNANGIGKMIICLDEKGTWVFHDSHDKRPIRQDVRYWYPFWDLEPLETSGGQ